MISWITDNLAVGELSDIEKENIEKNRIDAVLNLMVEENYDWKKDLPILTSYIHSHVGAFDPDINLIKFQKECEEAVKQLLNLFEDGHNRVLVHCVAGMDRSPFIAAIYLVKKGFCKNYFEAFEKIKKTRPFALEHSEWWCSDWGKKR